MLLEQQQAPDGKPPVKRPTWGFWNLLRRGLIWAIGLLLFFILLLQSPALQQWLGQRAIRSISKTLESRVELKQVRLAWLDELRIDSLFIEDKYGDTLLYAGHVWADFNLNPFVLLSRGLEIEEINISHSQFKIRRDIGDTQSNLAHALQRLFPPKDSQGKPLALNLKKLGLEEVSFSQQDSVKGKLIQLHIPSLLARLRQVDLAGQQFDINHLEIREPLFQLTNFAQHPLDSILLNSEVIAADTAAELADSISLRINATHVEVIDGRFLLNNYRKAPLAVSDMNAIDFGRLDVANINLEVVDIQLAKDSLRGQLKHLGLLEQSGFLLERLSVQELLIAPTTLVANGLEIITPDTRLGDTLSFSFREGWQAWSRFEDRVRMNIQLDASQLAVRDVLYFAHQLRFNPFFRDNQNRKLLLKGDLSGPVNSLRGRNVEVGLDEQNYLRGKFSSNALTKKGEQFLQLDLEQASTNMASLRSLIPSFKPPPSFDRLGKLRFTGRFDGFFANFVAYGNLRTDIGRSEMDMNMNLIPGVRKAIYSGAIALTDFDLGVFLNDPSFGTVSLQGQIKDGRGLVAETAAATLRATIEDFTFKDYTYQQAAISGQLNRNFFNGDFNIQDENIDFNFRGELDFRDSITDLNFTAQVDRIDLKALNLSKTDIVLSGDVGLNLRDTRFTDMIGRLEVKRLKLLKDGTDAYTVDTLLAYTDFNESGEKRLVLNSDIAKGEIVGQFDINELLGGLKQFMVDFYLGYADRLGIRAPKRTPGINNFTYEIDILDTKGFNYILHPQLGPIKDLVATGKYSGEAGLLKLDLSVPRFYFGNLALKDPIIRLDATGSEADLDVAIDSTYLNEKPRLGPLALLSIVNKDSIQFGINYASQTNPLFDKFNLNGLLYLPDSSKFRLELDPSRLDILQEPWEISGDNSITFGKNFLDTRNFRLNSGQREVSLSKEGQQGLNIDFVNFPLAIIDSVWNYPQLDFSGNFSVRVSIEDLFKLEGITATLQADTFLMNGDDYGWMRLDAKAANLKSQLTAYMSLNRDTAQLITEAIFNLQDLVEKPKQLEERKNYLDLNVAISGYPLALANYWVGGAVSGLEGDFNATMQVKGLTKQLDVSGAIQANQGAFVVNYLKTRYTFQEAQININNTLFDATGTVLRDRFGNRATVNGGISHNRLKNLGLAAAMNTDRFLALDLQKGDNALFYGRAIGSGRISFSGNFNQPDIYVRAEVGNDSRLVIPAEQAGSNNAISQDIRFVNKKIYLEPESTNSKEPTGVSLEMDLTVNQAANMEIIFDEEIGDKIQGNGRGNLRILLPRASDMQIFGNYEINSGSYLFTAFKLINKLFSVRSGGTIVWDGDPFDARLNLIADYEKLSTPISGFIQEYLIGITNSDLERAAARATDVNLSLLLQGQLLQPDINFDVSFPNLDGQLETFANNKRRLLLLDQNELNRQVFGLLIVGQFLPPDLSFSTNDVIVNSLAEWASNYMSYLINNTIAQAFGEEAFISSIDFDLAYNSYRSAANLGQSGNSRGDILELTLRKSFNRWTISLSPTLDILGNNQFIAQNSGVFLGNEFFAEYALNDARTLKFRIYQRLQPDLLSDRRLQVGAGISWRKEFDSFADLFGGINKKSRLPKVAPAATTNR